MKTLTCAAIALSCLVQLSAQDPGVTKKSIKLGQSCALKGPAAALGQGMRLGLNIYFDIINQQGGVKGRKISLVSLNDGYEPKRCARSTKVLIEKERVFALIGEVGTATSKVAVPIAEAAGVPFLAPLSGAAFLREPFRPLVVNMRGSYDQEMERLAQYVVDERGMQKVACFYQNDGYGKVGLASIEEALKRRGLKLCSTGHYKRSTLAVRSALEQISKSSPEAVVMVGAAKPCAEFIRQAKAVPETAGATFCNLSYVGTNALLAALDGNDQNCVVSQVIPFPWDTSISLVMNYHRDMMASGNKEQIGFISLEGYMAAKLFCAALSQIEGEPTRAKLAAQFAKTQHFDLGGVTLQYGADDNQGMDQVFLTRLHHGKIEVIETTSAAPSK